MDARRKIKSLNEIVAIIGSRPRNRTICMCHGVFDIVHPGHIRHLAYAKERADLLIASVTADRHVTKGSFRPHFNEGLRALNLAAYEMVDYVLVDDNLTPLENIAVIQPDYFAKGFEYAKGHPRTDAERAAVEQYGGEMLFTPGDFVRSSSAILNASLPDASVHNLAALMESNRITFADLRATLDTFSGLSAHVVGDTIVDTITETAPTGGIGKTPTLSVQVHGSRNYVGGAAVVAKHLKAAGASVCFTSVLGNDGLCRFVRDDLRQNGIDYKSCMVDESRPTVNKNAYVAGGYRLLKVDTLDNRPVSGDIVANIAMAVSSMSADIVVFSDFRHGLFNRDTIPELKAAIPKGAYRVADSQVASRWGNILEFQGFDLITPNEKEARFALGDQDSVIRPLASRLYEEAKCKSLILKCGDRGALCQHAPVGDDRYLYAVGSFARAVVDPVGAGDALLAYASLARKATGSDLVAVILGSVAAALECERDGNIPITPADILERLNEIEREAQYGPLKESDRSIASISDGTDLPSISRARAAIVDAFG